MNLKLNVNTSGALLTGKSGTVIQSHLDQAITEAALLLYARVTSHTPQGVFGAQGGLLGSIQQEVRGKGTPVVHGIVMSAHKYAEVIEKGRTANKGMPPKGSLLRWLEVKLGLDSKSASNIEFVVRRKIGRKGFEGAHMFEKAFNENLGKIQNIFERHGLSITQELNNG